jgi:hypothetical protein
MKQPDEIAPEAEPTEKPVERRSEFFDRPVVPLIPHGWK